MVLTTPSATVATLVYAIDFDSVVGACVREWHDLTGTVRPAETLPSHWYVEPGLLERELDRVFDRAWQYAGPAELVAEPGSFLTTRAGRVPIVVTRDERRRAERLRQRLPPPGRGGRARAQREPAFAAVPLPRLDVRARRPAARRPRARQELDLDDVALPPAAVSLWGPFVFVNPDPDAAPLDDFLGELPADRR